MILLKLRIARSSKVKNGMDMIAKQLSNPRSTYNSNWKYENESKALVESFWKWKLMK